MDRKIKGYTTLELLLVIALIGVLSFLFLKEFLVYISREKLKSSTEELASLISSCRNKSILSLESCGYCYNQTNRNIIFFIDENKNGKYDNERTINLFNKESYSIQINSNSSTIPQCPNAAIFDRRGELISGGADAHTIYLVNSYGENGTITVRLLGKISIRYGQ